MKKVIKFADDLSKLIILGEKTSTWRLFDDKNLQVGDEVEFVNKQTMQKFGDAMLLEVKETTLGELTDDDWVGHEKFPSEEAMYATYRKYYPNEVIDKDTIVKIIKFDFTPSYNVAFIDGQNLFFSGRLAGIEVNLKKLRMYLREKYKVEVAYYFLGSIYEKHQNLYDDIQKAGFILKFREHGQEMSTVEKGNVDTDIVFEAMKNVIKNPLLNKIIIISGDGDYFRMIKFLLEENKFLKILFPNHNNASSLYKTLTVKYFDNLDKDGVIEKIGKRIVNQKEKASLGN